MRNMAGNVIEKFVESQDENERAGWITKGIGGLFNYISDTANSFDLVNARKLSNILESRYLKLKPRSFKYTVLHSRSLRHRP